MPRRAAACVGFLFIYIVFLTADNCCLPFYISILYTCVYLCESLGFWGHLAVAFRLFASIDSIDSHASSQPRGIVSGNNVLISAVKRRSTDTATAVL